MGKSKSFTAYVQETFYNELFEAARSFVIRTPDNLKLKLRNVISPGYFELDDVHVQHIWVHGVENHRTMISFDVALMLDLYVHESGGRRDECDICNPWLMVKCQGDMAKRLSDFRIQSVYSYEGKEPTGNRLDRALDDSLVPYIGLDQLDQAAELFLQKYYPEALTTPMRIDPNVLAKKMGLTIVQQQITPDSSVFGQSFFKDCDEEIYDGITDTMIKRHIKRGTVLVDPNVVFAYNIGTYNNTVVHECVHWAFHQRALLLEQVINSSAASIKCMVVGGAAGVSKSSYDWMEWQANSLAPRIQMPLKPFTKKVKELYDQYGGIGKTSEIDYIQPVIDNLAEFFGVSRTAAKIRMVDAGFETAVGAFNYIDGRYIPTYRTFVSGYLERNQTFSISERDAVILSLTDSELRNRLKSGAYRYIDSHFVLDDPMFIETVDGSETLTHFARTHMDWCCLVFDLSVTSATGEKYHSECYLNRDRSSEVTFVPKYARSNPDPKEQVEMEKRHQLDMMEPLQNHPATFHGTLQAFINWSDIQLSEIEYNANISDTQLRRYRTDESYADKITVEMLFRLCMAMELPYPLSKELFRMARKDLGNTNRDLCMLHMLMVGVQRERYDTTSIFDLCNQKLTRMGEKPMTAKNKE